MGGRVLVGNLQPSGLFETEPACWVLSEEGEFCLRRVSYLGIEYHAPPLPEGYLLWQRARQGANVFELKFSTLPDHVWSFWDFCASLRASSAKWKEYRCGSEEIPDPLRKLDFIADAILEAAEHLHNEGWGLGLISPENILIFECGDGLLFAFTDLGFSWGDTPPLVPPMFLRRCAEGNKFAVLWDGENPGAQLERGRPLSRTEFDPVPDIRALVRVFASSLLGRYVSVLPTPEENPETRAQSPRIPGARRIWVTLEHALDGLISSMQEFRTALWETPLSQHFLAEAAVPVQGRIWRAVAGLGAVGALAAAVGLWMWIGTQQKEPTSQCSPLGAPDSSGKNDSSPGDTGSSEVASQMLANEGGSKPQPEGLPQVAQEGLKSLEEASELLREVESLWQSYAKDPVGTYFSTRRQVEKVFRPRIEKLSKDLEEIRKAVKETPSPELERVTQALSQLQHKLRQFELELSPR